MNQAILIVGALLGISLAVSVSGTLAALVLAFLIGLFVKFKERAHPAFQGLDMVVFCWALWMALTTVIHTKAPLSKAISSQSAVLIYFLLARLFKPEKAEWVIRWFLIASVIVGIVCLTQAFINIDWDPHTLKYYDEERAARFPQWFLEFFRLRQGRALGTRSHPLTIAEGLMPAFFVFLFAMGRAIRRGRESFRLAALHGLASLIIGAAIIATQGRGVWVACVIGSLLILISWPRRAAVMAVLAALVLGGAAMAVSPVLRNRALSIVAVGQNISDQQSRSMRPALWGEAAKYIRERPMMGYGIRGAKLQVIDPVSQQPRTWSEAHNIFFQTTLDGGFIALAIFIWMWIGLGLTIWSLPGAARWMFGALFIGFLLAGLTESWTRDKEIALIFFASIGALQAYYNRPMAWKRYES